jgi:mRNA interferase HicA
MSNLPQVKPRPLVNFFKKYGFIERRQVGSHKRLVHADGRKITVAMHNQPIAPGTFRSILKQANMKQEEFLKLFKKK